MAEHAAATPAAVDTLVRDLDRIFGGRLHALGTYAGHESDERIHTLAVVDVLRFDDLAACVPLTDGWLRRGLAVPLILAAEELRRTLDIFPLEYAAIAATLSPIKGRNPFEGVAADPADLRRAIETQAKSHLIHLREGFLESRGEAQAIAHLIASSAAPFRTVLASVARLTSAAGGATGHLTDEQLARIAQDRIGISSALVRDVFAAASPTHATIADPGALLSRYLDATERLWTFVDRWTA